MKMTETLQLILASHFGVLAGVFMFIVFDLHLMRRTRRRYWREFRGSSPSSSRSPQPLRKPPFKPQQKKSLEPWE
jgi:hypothetical protein